jgi:hypothetical protein
MFPFSEHPLYDATQVVEIDVVPSVMPSPPPEAVMTA